ncbi:tellurite resistance/C4-dicarboxylate transporter family protein [Nocardia blacklockiae]|uniref:tellurite resistance/C4-dicarboxylate transporter family protein n=1 Tax=Nocardia blacklockiae TaxID=480036 RepID=UPI001893A7D1|nr:tellurite resistance/C4-dicarboxylate transporter family protein [Nocardia blacklockiae]MBF6173291.1 tellurite resistance/C4-dicarboxylate transporter family protein [Nocardia blacklockiae]
MGEPSARRAAAGTRVAGVRNLKPGWFAAVMATGIVSRAVTGAGWAWGGDVLLVIGLVAFAVLTVATLLRLAFFPAEALADARNPAVGFTYLTFVAGSAVLAAGLAKHDRATPALVLLGIAAAAWLLLCYAIPAALMVHHAPDEAVTGADGTWFLWVVGTQSLAVAATLLPQPWGHRFAVPALLCWSVGVVLYLGVAALVLGTLFGGALTAAKLVPAYWVFMGATAISVLAGAQVLEDGPDRLVTEVRPFVAGAALALWAFGSWLIPLLLAAGVWRHLVRHFAVAYEPGLWSIVFPIGMYGVGTAELGRVLGAHWMVTFGHAEAWVALGAWLATAAALVVTLLRRRRRPAAET